MLHLIITSGPSNLTSRPHRRRKRTVQSYSPGCALQSGHIGAAWQTRLKSCFIQPTWIHKRNGKSIDLAVFAPITAECRRTHWRYLANTIELVLPLTHPSPQSKQEINRFSRFCTAQGRKSLSFPMGRPFPLKIAPFHGGSGPLGPPESSTQMASRSIQPFLQGLLVWQTNTRWVPVTVGCICVQISNNNGLFLCNLWNYWISCYFHYVCCIL